MATRDNEEIQPPLDAAPPAPDASRHATWTRHESVLYRRALPGLKDDRDWPELLETWMNEYGPDSPTFTQDVLRAAQSEFALRQEERRYDEANTKWLHEQEDVTLWDPKQNKLNREMKWRVDAAERTLLRWSGKVERLRRSRLLDRASLERLEKKSHNSAPASRPTLPSAASLPYVQSIYVHIVDGVTEAVYNPPTDKLLQTVLKANRDDLRVRRSVHFPEGLPPEYEWARAEDGKAPRDIAWSLSQEEFIREAKLEIETGGGHVLKSPQAGESGTREEPQNPCGEEPRPGSSGGVLHPAPVVREFIKIKNQPLREVVLRD